MKALRHLILAGVSIIPAALCAKPTQPDPSPAFFSEHCIRCHDAKKTKGGFRIDTLERDFAQLQNAERWDEILLRINSGEMPPEDEKQPSQQARAAIADWIHTRLEEGRALRIAKRPNVELLRLSREEYALSIQHLLGIHFDVDAPGALIDDPRWRGFNRIGSLLTLSPSHIDRYFEAAQKIIADAFPEKPIPPRQGRSDADTPRTREQLAKLGVTAPARQLVLPGKSFGSIDVRDPGTYRITVRLSALPSTKGRIPHLAIWDDALKRNLDGADVDIPENAPAAITLLANLPRGRFSILNQAPGTFEALTLTLSTQTPFTKSSDRRFVQPASHQLFDEQHRAIVPLLLIDSLEWEGPMPDAKSTETRAAYLPDDLTPNTMRSSLERFLQRAWRRDITPADLDPYLDHVQKEIRAGESPRNAYLSALVSALASKNFHHIHIGAPNTSSNTLSPWEIASRLSYFLWSSMPDDTLLALARNGKIAEPQILKEQVERMLDDPRSKAFQDHFPTQWLQLHRVGAFPPDQELYPDYDRWLQQSMIEEPKRFFAEVLDHNLPISHFLQSDWTVANPRLALFYGFPSPKKPGFQRVTLPANSHRGGILTQAAILSLTSDGTRHRPVHRGVLLSECLFAKTPPPPPPNVEPLEPTPADSPKATIRMQLAAHAKNPVCASCHHRIDPLGLAFDNFDALGRWREREAVASGTGENPLVDASGSLPAGSTFDGPDTFKTILSKDNGRFAEALTTHLATYALRRLTTLDDHPQIKRIAEQTASRGHRLRDLIHELVRSELFLNR